MNESETQQPKKKRHGCLIALAVVAGVIVLIIIIAIASNSAKGGSSNPTSTGSTAKTSASVTTKANGYITKAKFDQIQNGMSYDQVKQLIGSDGDVMSESGTKGDQYYTVVYDWKAKDGIGNATLEFQGDKLQTKAQAGLN